MGQCIHIHVLVPLLSSLRILEQVPGSFSKMLRLRLPHGGRSQGHTFRLFWIEHDPRSGHLSGPTHGVFQTRFAEKASVGNDRSLRFWFHVSLSSPVHRSQLIPCSVILMAVLRLTSGLKYNNTPTMLDFTWWFPEVLLFGCLECDFAIICASMPIFWPSVVAAWTEIFVTDEVIVRHDRRSQILNVSLGQMGFDQDGNRKSQDSTSALTYTSSSPGEKPFFKAFDPETGTGPGSGIALVEIKPCPPVARKLSRNS
jgi:hypothetical protein